MSSNTTDTIRLSLEITLEKMTLSNYIYMLRSRINKGYMPSATSKREFNTKPYYESVQAITNLSRGTGHYFPATDIFANDPSTENNPIGIQSNTHYFGLDSTFSAIDNTKLLDKNGSKIKEIKIITNLNKPISHTYVNIMSSVDNLWLGWVQWADNNSMAIPINPYELEKHLDIYT
jgi:hypothetical protein